MEVGAMVIFIMIIIGLVAIVVLYMGSNSTDNKDTSSIQHPQPRDLFCKKCGKTRKEIIGAPNNCWYCHIPMLFVGDDNPQCPTCHSYNIDPISSTSRAAHAVTFGFLSKTARSQFKCNNCGYKW